MRALAWDVTVSIWHHNGPCTILVLLVGSTRDIRTLIDRHLVDRRAWSLLLGRLFYLCASRVSDPATEEQSRLLFEFILGSERLDHGGLDNHLRSLSWLAEYVGRTETLTAWVLRVARWGRLLRTLWFFIICWLVTLHRHVGSELLPTPDSFLSSFLGHSAIPLGHGQSNDAIAATHVRLAT